jgi:hypothetical protein
MATSHAFAGPGSPEVRGNGFDLALPDPLRRMLCFFLFRAAASHAFAGAGSPEVRGDGGGLTLPDPLCRMLRFFLFCPATSHAFAGAGSPEVDDGFLRPPLRAAAGLSWAMDGVVMGCCVVVDEVMGCLVWLGTDLPTQRDNQSPYTKETTNLPTQSV